MFSVAVKNAIDGLSEWGKSVSIGSGDEIGIVRGESSILDILGGENVHCERWVFVEERLEGRGRWRMMVLSFAMISYDWSYHLSEVCACDGVLVDFLLFVA